MRGLLRNPSHLPIWQILKSSLVIQSSSTGCHHIKLLAYYSSNKYATLVIYNLESPIPNLEPHPRFLDNYVAMGSFGGKAFTMDAVMVYMIIINLCGGNNTDNANAKILMRHQCARMI